MDFGTKISTMMANEAVDMKLLTAASSLVRGETQRPSQFALA